jgi:DNA-binding transcriptional MocR family regulator
VQTISEHFPEDTRVSRPEGGYVLWVELPKGADVMQIYSQALAENISIAPGPIFSASRGFRNCMRLNYGLAWDERLQTAVRRVGELAKKQLG